MKYVFLSLGDMPCDRPCQIHWRKYLFVLAQRDYNRKPLFKQSFALNLYSCLRKGLLVRESQCDPCFTWWEPSNCCEFFLRLPILLAILCSLWWLNWPLHSFLSAPWPTESIFCVVYLEQQLHHYFFSPFSGTVVD